MPLEPTQTKQQAIEHLLHEGGKVMVVLDSRREGVLVPSQHHGDPRLHIVLNLRAPNPIHFEAEGIASTLFFGGIPTPCFFPWEAIWAAYIPDVDRGAVWEESVPLDMPSPIPPERTPEAEQSPPESPAHRPSLSVITRKSDAPATKGTGKGKKPPHLKVIK